MHRHRIDATLAPVDFAQGGMKRVVVDAAVSVGQRSVDVKQVGVELTPIEL
jgi:hypothetical protein